MRWHLRAGGEVCPTHRSRELHKVYIRLCLGLSDWAQWAAEGAVCTVPWQKLCCRVPPDVFLTSVTLWHKVLLSFCYLVSKIQIRILWVQDSHSSGAGQYFKTVPLIAIHIDPVVHYCGPVPIVSRVLWTSRTCRGICSYWETLGPGRLHCPLWPSFHAVLIVLSSTWHPAPPFLVPDQCHKVGFGTCKKCFLMSSLLGIL